MRNTEENPYKSTVLFTELETISVEVKQRKKNLTSSLSLVDKKIADIEHYIEFYPLSASKGYKVAKMLKDCLEERRKIKNELEMIENILRMNIGFIGKGKGNEILSSIDNRKYIPRVLNDLFDS